MAPGGGLAGWPGCRQRDLAFRGLRTNIDSSAAFCTWRSTLSGLGYVADLCSGGHLPRFLILPAGTWAALTPSGSGCCVCLLGVPSLCLRRSAFAFQRLQDSHHPHPSLLCVPTALPIFLHGTHSPRWSPLFLPTHLPYWGVSSPSSCNSFRQMPPAGQAKSCWPQ